MKRSIARVCVLAAICTACIALGASPALAVYATPVPNHAVVGSTDLYGMNDADARAAIARDAALPALPPLDVNAAGRSFPLDAARAVTLDVDAMLAQAYAPSAEPTVTLVRRVVVDTVYVDSYLASVAAAVNHPAANAAYYLSGGRLLWRPAVIGGVLQVSTARVALIAALTAEGLSGSAQPAVTLNYITISPKVTDATLGRAIVVDLSDRKLRLWDHSTKLREFGVAIGMKRYPTPRGSWRVVRKTVNPTWRNPGSDWATDMPVSIRPGYYNPLGTRALYLNAPGIRIHGTSKLRSIGRAASHGCVRVANRNIEKLYPLVAVGTPVYIVP
jgi:lipoprotein-anchoring transpeptidase ErfK/SrfK